MKHLIAGLTTGLGLCMFWQAVSAADSWSFGSRIPVTEQAGAGVFHHLEGAGRKHIALSGQTVTVIWEDDHTTSPQIYVAQKNTDREEFSAAQQVSAGKEAYEPAITGILDNRFVMVYEQDGSVDVRSLSGGSLSPPLRLSAAPAGHASITSFGNQVFASWREQHATGWSVQVASITVGQNGQLQIESTNRVEAADIPTAVLFPSIAVHKSGLIVAWEDRRAGHTRLNYSFSSNSGATFSEPSYLNEFYSNRNQYDRGSGVTRVSLAVFGEDEVLAAWMDKRQGSNGYGIYAAQAFNGSFGPDEKVHSPEGGELAHLNPATAGNRKGDFVVVWDDFRSGDSDIWLSRYNEEGVWSDDLALPPAAGEGEQTHVSAALDELGGMHLVWIERTAVDAPSRLWYSHATELE